MSIFYPGQTDYIERLNELYAGVFDNPLPIATSSILGGIKVGANLSIDPVTGILSAPQTNVSYTNVAQTFTKNQKSTPVTLSVISGHVTIDFSLSNVFKLTLTADTIIDNVTLTNYDGSVVNILVKQDGTGGHTLTLGSMFMFDTALTFAVSSAANARTMITGLIDTDKILGAFVAY